MDAFRLNSYKQKRDDLNEIIPSDSQTLMQIWRALRGMPNL